MRSPNGVRRAPAKRISVFNHKGGVGKTTLTLNLAATLANEGRRVLLVDTDPQCNLTSYLVADEVVDDLLDSSDGEDGRTIWSALRPVHEATGGVVVAQPLEPGIENLYLVPGDIRLSEFETDLAEFWGQCLQRKMRGFRGTTALSEVANTMAEKLGVDYVFFDSGPNIGPLNRAILLDSDYFIVPVACDLFSLRALKTLGRTLGDWIGAWSTICDLAPRDMYLLPGRPVFLGYIPEGFRVYGGRASSEHSAFLSRIDKEVSSQIVQVLRGVHPSLAPGRSSGFKLGEIKHFGQLVLASQNEGKPIYDVTKGSAEQRMTAREAFRALAKKVADRTRRGSE